MANNEKMNQEIDLIWEEMKKDINMHSRNSSPMNKRNEKCNTIDIHKLLHNPDSILDKSRNKTKKKKKSSSSSSSSSTRNEKTNKSCSKNLSKKPNEKNKIQSILSYCDASKKETNNTLDGDPMRATKEVVDDTNNSKVIYDKMLQLIEVAANLNCEEDEDSDDEDNNEMIENKYDQNNQSLSTTTSSLSSSSDNIINLNKMKRFTNLLQSENYNTKVETFTILYNAIDYLVNQLQDLPELNFPSPYKISNISLSYNSKCVVSDMTSGTYIPPQWSQWQNTHNSIHNQFNNASSSIIHLDRKKQENSKEDEEFHPNNKSCNTSSSIKCTLQKIFDICGKILYQTIAAHNTAATSEKCRQLAIKSLIRLNLSASLDMSSKHQHIGLLMSAILCNYQSCYYDKDLMIFVYDMDEHERYKRGSAVERQDRINLLSISNNGLVIIEKSEEIRLLLCELIYTLIRGLYHHDSNDEANKSKLHLLTPYYTDIILSLQTHVQDPCPTIKIKSSYVLIQIIRIPEWEDGAKYFALAMARSTIPNMRHSHAKVRIAAISLFEACVSIPDRDKVKGAGTEAISDLIGFREDNVIPVASFYESKCGVSVNCLAELAIDRNSTVRSHCCSMLAHFMTCLPNRHDYHQRLLPYLLGFFHDSNVSIQQMAIESIEQCGQQYEIEHPDDVIERRQYGVDGDTSRCNYAAKLPNPFTCRPRLGARLFVRDNTKHFFKALLREISCSSSWNVTIKHQSTSLLIILIAYCEEYLTMGFLDTLLNLCKGYNFTRFIDNDDEQLQNKYRLCFELLGRFIDPETYVLFLPRMKGDANGSLHSEKSRATYASAFQHMFLGSLVERLYQYKECVIETFTSDECIGPFVGSLCKLESMKALTLFLERVLTHDDGGKDDKEVVVKDNILFSAAGEKLHVLISSIEKKEDKDILMLAKKCCTMLC